MKPAAIAGLTVALLAGCSTATLPPYGLSETVAGTGSGVSGNRLERGPGRHYLASAVHHRGVGFPRYYGAALADRGEVVSRNACPSPVIEQVCRQDYALAPDAVWPYFYFSETERQVAEARARRYARTHGGQVRHEGSAYVVYQGLPDCGFEVASCQGTIP